MKPPDEFLDFAVKMCGPQVVRLIDMWEEERHRIGEAECGTRAGYQRHLYQGESACAECNMARAEYARCYYRSAPEKWSEYQRAWIARRSTSGKCRCGADLDLSFTRCSDCRSRHAEQSRQRRRTNGASPRVAPQHGTLSMYSNRGCRCDPCRQATSDYNRAYHARRKAMAS
jgi:hypothetical protein